MLDIDTKQRIKVVGIFILQLYKIITGSLLTLFIPQSCGSQICTLQQNYNNTELYHSVSLYWNIFTACMFLIYYMIELKRENWAIKYLDIDNDKPDNALKEIIKSEPILDKRMDKLNIYYYRFLVITCICYFINIGLTVKIINDKYHSISTISCFTSFVLLVIMKLYNSLIVAKESIHNDKMMSSFMVEFVSYNVLDADYLKQKYGNQIDNKELNRP